MSKSIIRNILGGQTLSFAVPATAEDALAFCQNNLDGEYIVLEQASKVGNADETSVVKVTVTGQSTAGYKTTFSFYAKANKSETDIRTALQSKTFNKVKFDKVYIIEMSLITIGA